jgi:hypothetical protein
MRGRGLVWGAVSAGAALALWSGTRQLPQLAQDLKRYNLIRSMSGEPPFLLELPVVLARVLRAETPQHPKRFVKDVIDLPISLARDATRYLMMMSM